MKRFGLAYPIVSDPELAIVKAYGVRQKGLDVSLPSTFVVDASGTIRFVRVGKHPLDRPTLDEILRALRSS